MKNFLILIFSIIFFGIYNVNASFDISSLKNIKTYVIDQTNTLNTFEKTNIENIIEDIRKETTAEILVVLTPTIWNEDIWSLATNIWQTLWVGRSDVDNGVVILIAKEDRAWYIATGYWVEWILPDIRVKQIWEKNFPSNFRNWNYGKGIEYTLKDIKWFLIQDSSIISKYKSNNPFSFVESDFFSFFIFLYIISLIILWRKNFWRKLVSFFIFSVIWVIIFQLFIIVPIFIIFCISLIPSWTSSGWGRKSSSNYRSSSSRRSWWFWWGSFWWWWSWWKW